jgi:hypothetical protein
MLPCVDPAESDYGKVGEWLGAEVTDYEMMGAAEEQLLAFAIARPALDLAVSQMTAAEIDALLLARQRDLSVDEQAAAHAALVRFAALARPGTDEGALDQGGALARELANYLMARSALEREVGPVSP